MSFKEYYYQSKKILELSFVLAIAEFKLRNEGSYLGIFWYLLNPLLVFALLFAVFSNRLGNDISQYPLYLFLGIIMFNFFQGATTDAVASIEKNKGIIKSINFPKEALVASLVLKNLFSHFFELAIFISMLLFFNVTLVGILYYFLILIIFCFFIFGISLVLACLRVYFVDLESIWAFAVRLLWLGTPIFYAIAGQQRLYDINLFNPMYYFITIARDPVIYGKFPNVLIISGTIFYTALSFFLGLLLFNMFKNKFSEKI